MRHCSNLFSGVRVRPDSEAGFSTGVYHAGQPPMLEMKGKGGNPVHGGRNQSMDRSSGQKMRPQNPDAVLEFAVSGLASLAPRLSSFVSSVQNGRGTIYWLSSHFFIMLDGEQPFPASTLDTMSDGPAALGSCIPKTHLLADIQAD